MRECPDCGASYRGSPTTCPIDGVPLCDADDANLGREVGGWLLGELLGEGAMASVYRATRDDTMGALKLYRSALPTDRGLREGEAQLRVRHARVAEMLDRGVSDDGQPFLVMRYVRGRPLRSLLAPAGRRLSARAAGRLAVQVADGLGAIHQHGLVHRDLKPENLIIDGPADALEATILDLGHAMVLDLGRLTESGLVWGSAPYMSPEQAAGQTLDHRSDLYSLGVVLYEMLVGRRPFEAKAAVDLMQMHCANDPVPPAQRAPVAESLSDLCCWLLAKHPDHRPESARVVKAALAGILGRDGGADGAEGVDDADDADGLLPRNTRSTRNTNEEAAG